MVIGFLCLFFYFVAMVIISTIIVIDTDFSLSTSIGVAVSRLRGALRYRVVNQWIFGIYYSNLWIFFVYYNILLWIFC